MTNDTNGLSDALRRLAKIEAGDVPVLSAYLDLRPHAVGNPAVRTGQLVLRDRLREIERKLKEHTPEHRSLQADAEWVEARIEEALPEVQGLAAFACSAQELYEAVELPVAVESEVAHAPLPYLLPLARLADQRPALLALYASNTLRLFLVQAGNLKELPGHDAPAEEFGDHLGVLENRVGERKTEFGREASDVIERTIARHSPAWLILWADEVSLPYLRDKLSKRAAGLLRETSMSLVIRASYDEILAEVTPVIERLRREDAQSSADDLVGEVAERDLGVAGVEETRRALEFGQGLELVIDERAQLPEEELASLVRLAASTDVRIRFIDGHEGLLSLGGVGALLRFRIDEQPLTSPDTAVPA